MKIGYIDGRGHVSNLYYLEPVLLYIDLYLMRLGEIITYFFFDWLNTNSIVGFKHQLNALMTYYLAEHLN